MKVEDMNQKLVFIQADAQDRNMELSKDLLKITFRISFYFIKGLM